MRSALRLGSIHQLPACLIGLLVGLSLSSTAAADLPSSVASRVKQINSALDAADQALEADHLQTAQRKLKDVQRLLKEIKDRYAGKFDENDAVYKAMLDHLAATTARVEAAEQQAAGSAAASAADKASHEALCQEWVAKLGSFVDHKSDQYLRVGSTFNSASPEDQAKSKAAYARAKVLFDQYQLVKFSQEKTRNLKNVESSLISSMDYYGSEEASAAQEAACRDWVDRLAPYFDSGMNSERKLIAAATMDTQQIAQQQALYEQARALFAAYRQAEFPEGKSFELQTLEAAMVEKLEEFPKAMAESRAMLSGDVGTRLDQVLRSLNQDTDWKQDSTKKPLVIMERVLEPLREAIQKYSGTVEADDARLVELQKKLKAIEDQTVANRAVCAERTFQRADGYSGSDLKDLKQKAREVAAAACANGTIHLITVPSREWAIEDVIEFADTSNTAVRHRITRSVRAEVSLKDGDGMVWLQGVYLGQDRLPDGGWSAVKAHTTWTDPMGVENLGQTIPGTQQ